MPSHYGKVTSDKKIIFNSYQSSKGGKRDYFSHFLVIFETTSKFLIVFVRLILENVTVDGFAWPPLKIDIRCEFEWKVISKGLGFK